MADSPEAGKSNRIIARTESFFQSTANHVVGWIITSILGGTSAAYVLTSAELVDVGKGIKEVVTDAKDDIKGELARMNKGVAARQKDIQEGVDEVIEELGRNGNEMRSSFRAADGSRASLANAIRANGQEVRSAFSSIDDDLRGISLTVNKIDRDTAGNHKEVIAEFRALFDQFHSYHQTFVDQLKGLADTGRGLIDEETPSADHMADMETWIAKVNYVLRSLPIPTEEGLLRDTSIVKEDLRKAMRGFAKATDDHTRMAHARSVLVIVEAVVALASSGRIPRSLASGP